MPRLKLADDIVPIRDIRTRTAELLAKLKSKKRAIILTQRGRPVAVLEDIREYERQAEYLQLLESVLAGLRASEKGDVVSHKEALAELNKVLHD